MAGILDGYFSPAEQGGILSRLPEWMLPHASQYFSAPDFQQTQPAPTQTFGHQAPIFPGMGSMGGAAGYGAGMDAPPQQQQRPDPAQLPQTSMPVESPSPVGMPAGPQGQQAPQAQPAPPAGPGMLDRLTAGATNFTTGGNPIAGLFNMIGGLSTGQRTDPGGIAQQNQVATAQALYHALAKSGRYTPEEAKGMAIAAAGNPGLATALLPQAFGTKYEAKTIKGPLGDESLVAFDPIRGTIKSSGGEDGNGMSSGQGGPQMLAPGVKKYDPTLTGPDYMSQFGPEVQSIAKAYLNGDQMPTGNPRLQGMLPFSKTVATKYAQDMGIPFSDNIYNEKRKMRTDLASSGNSSMGGILANGDSSFAHLAEAAVDAAKLKNVDINIPIIGGGYLAHGVNRFNNQLTASSQRMGEVGAVRQNLGRYGQESTKFYAATGGGEGERMAASREHNPAAESSAEQAAFYEKEKALMLDRLNGKFAQLRATLGEEEAQRVIAQKMPRIEETVKKLDTAIAKLRGDQGAAQNAPTQSGPVRVSSPAEAAKLPKGTRFLDPNGVERIVP